MKLIPRPSSWHAVRHMGRPPHAVVVSGSPVNHCIGYTAPVQKVPHRPDRHPNAELSHLCLAGLDRLYRHEAHVLVFPHFTLKKASTPYQFSIFTALGKYHGKIQPDGRVRLNDASIDILPTLRALGRRPSATLMNYGILWP